MATNLLECKTEKDILSMERDNFTVKDFGLLTDGFSVWLSEQAMGEMPTQKIRIPKPIFDALVKRYIGAR